MGVHDGPEYAETRESVSYGVRHLMELRHVCMKLLGFEGESGEPRLDGD